MMSPHCCWHLEDSAAHLSLLPWHCSSDRPSPRLQEICSLRRGCRSLHCNICLLQPHGCLAPSNLGWHLPCPAFTHISCAAALQIPASLRGTSQATPGPRCDCCDKLTTPCCSSLQVYRALKGGVQVVAVKVFHVDEGGLLSPTSSEGSAAWNPRHTAQKQQEAFKQARGSFAAVILLICLCMLSSIRRPARKAAMIWGSLWAAWLGSSWKP